MPYLRSCIIFLSLLFTPLLGQWLEKTVELPSVPGPRALAFSSATNTAFLGGAGSYVAALDATRAQIVARIRVGRAQRGLCCDSGGNRVYVANYESDSVAVIDAATRSLVASIPAGDGPAALCYNASNRKVYCANERSNSVTVIDATGDSVVATVPVGSRPAALLWNPASNKVYCANRSGDSVTVVDGASNLVLATVRVGGEPVALDCSPASNRVYCANFGGNTVSVIDGVTNAVVRTIAVGSDPIALCHNPTNNTVWCANNYSRNVSVINAATNSVVATVLAGVRPNWLSHNPVNNRIYCSNRSDGVVTVIDGATYAVVGAVGVGDHPAALCISPQSNLLFSANSGSDDVSLVNCATHNLFRTLPTRAYPVAAACDTVVGKVYCVDEAGAVAVLDSASCEVRASISCGTQPRAVCVNSEGRKAYCANSESDDVTVISTSGDSVLATIPVGDRPSALWYSPELGRLYCANYSSDNVSVIDGVTNAVLATVPVGRYPAALCFSPASGKLYCANSGSHNVTIIDAATNSARATVPTGSFPFALGWGSRQDRVYCASSYNHNVTVIDGVTDRVRATVAVGAAPLGFCYDSLDDRIYCGSYAGTRVYVIDGVSDSVTGTVPVGTTQRVLRYLPKSHRFYCTNEEAARVTGVLCARNQPVWNIPVGSEPADIAYDSPRDRLYVPNYASASVSVIHDAPVDVAVVGITCPGQAYEPSVVITPAARWLNCSNDSASFECWMTLFDPSGQKDYSACVSMDALAPGRETLVSFSPQCTLAVTGTWTVRCSTYFAGDLYSGDDTLGRRFTVYTPDVGVYAIWSPTYAVDTGATLIPQAGWRVHHGAMVPFRAWFTLTDPGGTRVYQDSQDVSARPVGSDVTLEFRSFNVGTFAGTWLARCSTWAVGDTTRRNDTLDRHFVVRAGSVEPQPGWSELEPVPLSSSGRPVGHGGWLAYMDGDECVYGAKGNKTGDFFRYDPLACDWLQLAPIPTGNEDKPPGKGANATTDADRFLYATKGNNTLGFWRYDVERNSWRQLADVPPGIYNKKVKGGADLAYVDEEDTPYVYLLKGYKNEFYRYNVESNTWATLEPAPVGANVKWDKGSWMVYDQDGALYAHKARFHELWKYDVTETRWVKSLLSSLPQVGRSGSKRKLKDGGCAVWLDDAIYVLKGGNTQEFWRYEVEADAWSELDAIPLLGSTGRKKKVKSGGDIACDGSDWFFALKGNRSREFWRYILSWSVVWTLPERGGVTAGPAARGPASIEILPGPVVSGFVVLRYVLPAAGELAVELYDVSGRLRAARSVAAGRAGDATLDLRGLASGVYLARLAGSGYSTTARLVIAR